MQTAANKLLDKVKESCALPSDNVLSQRLGVTRGLLSGWRHDRYPIPDNTIAELCTMAKLDAPIWLAEIHAERATSKAEKAMWRTALDRLSAAAAVVALVSIGVAGMAPEKAYASTTYAAEKSHSLYIM
ncbi:DUF3693 domain-containing protein [Pseudoxanthomonas sp.]|uniref:DUF3693 domain-containing protein n=1 Tax=Pseudoxanthomonas sp. TaxID=1871049 RepID=UPI0026240AF0|nr:DUF3693 domain-containing protein [Pseudoxanthomonas sp.]WDS36976.1 MAG: DUF3693 domain-containing protein [Pseudoxanthomonas sp.]